MVLASTKRYTASEYLALIALFLVFRNIFWFIKMAMKLITTSRSRRIDGY